MRTLSILCACLLLAGCPESPDAQKKEPPKKAEPGPVAATHPIGSDNDSSPIIISDGSIHVKNAVPNRDFSNKNDRDADIDFAYYSPAAIGFLCDPSTNYYANSPLPACPANVPQCDSAAVNTAACKVSLGTTATFKLALCENNAACNGNGTVSLEWNKSASKSLIKSKSHSKDFAYTAASNAAGGEQIHGGARGLTNATLQRTGIGTVKDVQFACSTPLAPCLAVAYECNEEHQCLGR